MPQSDGHRRFEEDLAAYVVGNLDQADRIAFEAHLDQCGRCRSDLDWLSPAAGVLAASVPQRRRTLAAARSVPRADTSEPRWRSRAGAPRLAALGAASAAVAAAIVLAVGLLADENGPGSSTVAVQPAGALQAGAGGQLVVRDGTATLEIARMPPLPSSEVYEAWVQRDGALEPSSTFIVDRNGTGAVTIPGVDGADRVMVTREPRGGSDRPTTAPLLEAPL